MSKVIDALEWRSIPLGLGVMLFRGHDKRYVVWATKLGLHGITLIGYEHVGEFKNKREALACYEDCKELLKKMEAEKNE